MSGETPAVREALPVYVTEVPETERVPPGYRRTEVGVIPEDWEIVPLSELLDFRNGVNAEKGAYGQGTPFINVLEVITHTHLRGSDVPGRVTLPSLLVNSYAVHRGDILFNRTSETQEEVGLTSVYLGDETVVFGGFVIRGRSRGTAVDEIYSGYAFRSPIIRSQIVSKGQGAVRANIGQQELSKVVVALPPLSEQRAIAAALSDVDALISALDKLIAKKRAVKTAAMQQLLTGEQRLPGFSGEWETKRLGDLLVVRHGKSQRQVVAEDGIYPILASGGEIGRSNAFLYDRPSVLIGRKGTIDNPQYQDLPFWTVDTVAPQATVDKERIAKKAGPGASLLMVKSARGAPYEPAREILPQPRLLGLREAG